MTKRKCKKEKIEEEEKKNNINEERKKEENEALHIRQQVLRSTWKKRVLGSERGRIRAL